MARFKPGRLPILFFAGLFSMGILLSGFENRHSSVESAKFIPIQHNGRVKPFDSFARQTLKLITGAETWQKKEPTLALLDALAEKDKIGEMKWIRLDYLELKEALGLPKEEHFFCLADILPSLEKIKALVRSSQAKRADDMRPNKLEQKAETLLTQYMVTNRLVSGEIITVIPASQTSGWASPYKLDSDLATDFKELIALYRGGSFQRFEEETAAWIQRTTWTSKEISAEKIFLEVLYFKIRPFEWAAVAYLIAFAFLSVFKRMKTLILFGFLSLFAAIFFHTAGILFRVIILSRPPVSNMYESMIFMNWAVMVFALVFSLIKRSTPALIAGSMISALVMIYGNLLPIDASLDVLVPVLRSNYWLSIHVMTIVSSYGAFGLAMALGHRHLFCAAFNKFSKDAEEESAQLIYRVIQLGILLIGTGTVLGGVWANESWGRFWGWDPKETWALITFLGYLIVVHLRYTKKLNNFVLSLCSVVGFLLVLMTWYGVNFVLGRGLHSYGQGAGGMAWVVYFLIFEALFLGFIVYKKTSLRSA